MVLGPLCAAPTRNDPGRGERNLGRQRRAHTEPGDSWLLSVPRASFEAVAITAAARACPALSPRPSRRATFATTTLTWQRTVVPFGHGQESAPAQTDLPVALDGQHLHLDLVALIQHIGDVLRALVGDLGHV